MQTQAAHELTAMEEKLLRALGFSPPVLNSWKGAALRDGVGRTRGAAEACGEKPVCF